MLLELFPSKVVFHLNNKVLGFHRVLMHSPMGTGAALNSASFSERRNLQSIWFRLNNHIIATAPQAQLPHTVTVTDIRSTPTINYSAVAAVIHRHTFMYEHVIHHIYATAQAEDRCYFVYNIAATDRSLQFFCNNSLFSAGGGVRYLLGFFNHSAVQFLVRTSTSSIM